MEKNIESLYVSGFIDPAERFTAGRCYSVHAPAERNTGPSAFALETIDASGTCLRSVAMRVDHLCELRGTPARELSAQVDLDEAAARVRITREGCILWESPVRERARLELKSDVRRASREAPLMLHVSSSAAFAGAVIQIFYEWAPGRSRVIDVVAPADRYSVDLRHLPGGTRCRVVAHYSNGMRSATAATEVFSVPELPARVEIIEPAGGERLRFGQPIEMLGQAIDPQATSNDAEQSCLTWLLDGDVVGRGPVGCIMQPRSGTHVLELVHERSGQRASSHVIVDAPGAADAVPASLWDADEL